MASRTSILETLPKVVANPPKIKPKLTISSFEKVFFDIRGTASEHPYLTIGLVVGVVLGSFMYGRKRRRTRGGFFRLDDEKNGLLGGNSNGKVD
jgi:protein disulfide-isomerase